VTNGKQNDGGGVPPPRTKDATTGEGTRPPPPDDATTGLPGFRSWRSVYLFVLGVFVLWVVLLTVLTEVYS